MTAASDTVDIASSHRAGDAPPVDVRMVADSKMEELAKIEFVPPKGIEPWQGAVLINERIDRATVSAWVSGLVAKEALTLTDDDGVLVVHRGPHYDRLDADTRALVDQLLDNADDRYEIRIGGGVSDVSIDSR